MTCLETLHNAYLEKLPDSEKMDYLMNCVTFLSEGDVTGWKRKYQPDAFPGSNSIDDPPPTRKRRRISPDAVLWKPLDPCMECGSEEVVEDTDQGRTVCTSCGMIQVTQLLGTASSNMTYEQLKNGPTKKIHYYSRVVYFRSILMGIQALTNPQISDEELHALRAACAGSKNIDVNTVIKALRKTKMSSKFRRHRFTITRMLNPQYKPLVIKGHHFYDMLKYFTRIEFNYMFMKDCMGTRRSFFSYTYIFYQICYHMDVMHYTGPQHLLNDPRLLSKLHAAYKPIAIASHMDYDISM
jgi:hypothetical protein